jgi:hypothetical protein
MRRSRSSACAAGDNPVALTDGCCCRRKSSIFPFSCWSAALKAVSISAKEGACAAGGGGAGLLKSREIASKKLGPFAELLFFKKTSCVHQRSPEQV